MSPDSPDDPRILPIPPRSSRQEEGRHAFTRALGAIAARDLVGAEVAFTLSLSCARDAGDSADQGRALQGLGLIADHRRNYQLALDRYQQALECYGNAPFLTGQMLTQHLIGIVALRLDRRAAARQAFTTCQDMAHVIGHLPWYGKACFWLNKLALAPAEETAAQQYWSRVLREYEEHGDETTTLA
ncbi:MAG: hypothetical protein H0X24_17670 [Ktedonobacterales bacterium]|nr:hypothetical protein [Ktedonobacterales bacterium]